MPSPSQVTLLVTLLIVLLMVAEAPAIAMASKADVNIFNELGEAMALHCKSGNRDLREHQIAAGGLYGWGFSPNWFGSTLYWCSFQWRNLIASFDVWTDAGIFKPVGFQLCWHCEWRVRPDGFYRNDRGYPQIKVHNWN